MVARNDPLPEAPFERILKNNGARRVSQGAALALRKMTQEHGESIIKEAQMYAEHAGRRTITEKDIRLAVKNVSLR
ncbi:histone family protein [Candidatus Woesearchaeota archaeon]|nr:histone family protein [Candidatus Woesearchaeota archaeon]